MRGHMSKKPSQNPAPRVNQGGLLPGSEGEAAPGLRGRETPQKGDENALPIRKGWGSKMVRWLEAVDRGSVIAWKAVEWGLMIFIGLSWLIFALLAMILG
jgi:hypothetical protein